MKDNYLKDFLRLNKKITDIMPDYNTCKRSVCDWVAAQYKQFNQCDKHSLARVRIAKTIYYYKSFHRVDTSKSVIVFLLTFKNKSPKYIYIPINLIESLDVTYKEFETHDKEQEYLSFYKV